MASMRDIKRRKSSIAGTQQITRAMKLVSTVKLQRAKARAEMTKPYFDCMYDTMAEILSKSEDMDHPYLRPEVSSKKAVIVITSDRGLAGGYHSNIVKLITEAKDFRKEDLDIYALGRKGKEALSSGGYRIAEELSGGMNGPVYSDAEVLSKKVLERFARGEVGGIYLAYTAFKNTVTQVPTLLRLLPVEPVPGETSGDLKVQMNYEPSAEEVLNRIIPQYVTSLIYGAMAEAAASENGARMQAMDSAAANAEEMLQDLSLKYNRARQGSITQELTEIVAGASAIS